MAGNVRSLDELIDDQLQWLGVAGPEAEKQKAQIMRSLPASYMEDLRHYHPAEEARELTLPMLILQGERDYQVTMRDFNLWKAELLGRPNLTFRSYPALNHLFIAGEGKSLPAEYDAPGHIQQEVIRDIANWILRSGG